MGETDEQVCLAGVGSIRTVRGYKGFGQEHPCRYEGGDYTASGEHLVTSASRNHPEPEAPEAGQDLWAKASALTCREGDKDSAKEREIYFQNQRAYRNFGDLRRSKKIKLNHNSNNKVRKAIYNSTSA